MRILNISEYVSIRRALRTSAVKSERLLWGKLRARHLQWKFRRQHGIGCYIVDFFCPELKLVIEVDGISHEREDVSRHDVEKRSYLEKQGVTVMRFTTQEVCNELDRIVENISQQCEALHARQN